MRPTTRWMPVFALALVVACGDATAPTIETTTFAPSLGIDLSTMTKSATGLYYKDLIVGQGATAAAGQTASVHYTGSLANGTEFDSNGPGDPPLTVELGSGGVIPGFDEGIRGMKVGGRRQVIIPPALGYGATPNGPIPANSILVFTIDLVSLE